MSIISTSQSETGYTVKPEELDLAYWPPEWRGLKTAGLDEAQLRNVLAQWKEWARKDMFARLFAQDGQQFKGTHWGYQAAIKARYVAWLSTQDIYARRVQQTDFGLVPGVIDLLFGRTGPYAPRQAEVQSAMTNVQRMDVVMDGLRKEADTALKGILDQIETEMIALKLLDADIARREALIATYEKSLSADDPEKIQALVRDKPEEDLAALLDHLASDRIERIQTQARIAGHIFDLKGMRALAIDPKYSRPRSESQPAAQPPFSQQPVERAIPQAPEYRQPNASQPSLPRAPAVQQPGNSQLRPFQRPAQDGGPPWNYDSRTGTWYRDLPATSQPRSVQPISPFPQRRSEVRQTLSARDLTLVDVSAQNLFGLLPPARSAELLPVLSHRQGSPSLQVQRASDDLPGQSEGAIRDLFLMSDKEAKQIENADTLPLLFVRAAFFDRAPLSFFIQMVRAGLPLVVVFEQGEADRYHAVERLIQKKVTPQSNPGKTFFVLAPDGSPALISALFAPKAAAAEQRYQVASGQNPALQQQIQSLTVSDDMQKRREAAFLGIEARDARRVSSTQIPFRFYYTARAMSSAEWDYRLRMLRFVIQNAAYWPHWAGEAPADLRALVGHIFEQLEARRLQDGLINSAA